MRPFNFSRTQMKRMAGGHLLLLAALVGAFSQVAAASEPTLSLSVLQRKLQPVLQLLEKDCLSELLAVRDSKGGLVDGLDETKIFLAVGRGQPADLFRSGNRKLVKAAMNNPEIRVAFEKVVGDSLSDDGDNDDGWVDFHGTKEAWKVLSGSSLFEASKEDRRLRVRSWAEKHAMQMQTTLRLLTASWWPLERSQAVWEASTMSQSQHWFLRLFLEVTVWTIADSTLAVLRLAAPRAGFVLDYLDWGTKGYGDKFRTATVVLPGLILVYYMIFLLIELINLTFVVVLMIFGLVKSLVSPAQGASNGPTGGSKRSADKRKTR